MHRLAEDLEEYHKKNIEDLIEKQTTEDFKCYDLGTGVLCNGKDIGLESFILCLEKRPEKCNFSFPFGTGFFCKCPLRIYIAKEFKK
jgi:hypothetical protein